MLASAVGIVFTLVLTAQTLLGIQRPDALVAKLDCPDRVNDVAFSPDGKLLAAGYGWNTQGGVKVWDAANQTVVATLVERKRNDSSVKNVAFSPDGELLAAANFDGDVTLWSTGPWRRLKKVIFRGGSPRSLSFSPDGTKLAFSSNMAVILYDLKLAREQKIATRVRISDDFSGASFSADGKSLAVCGRGAIWFWEVATGKATNQLRSKSTDFFCRFSPDGKHLIAGGGPVYGKKSVVVWEPERGKPLYEVFEFRSGLFGLAIANSGRLYAVSGGDYGSGGHLSVWSLNVAREVAYVSFGRFPIHGLAFSPDDTLLAAASADGFVLLYAVNLLRGPQVTKQKEPLCGEIVAEGKRAFIVPLAKVPLPMSTEFQYAWKLELAETGELGKMAGFPVVLTDWDIISNAATDRIRINKFDTLVSAPVTQKSLRNYVVFGDIQNPGWDEGFVVKIYGDGSFVAANNPGACLAYESLAELQPRQDMEVIKARLLAAGFLSIPKEPTALGFDHYRTRFIELSVNGVAHLRSDAEDVDLARNRRTNKKADFRRLFLKEEAFVSSILRAGKKLPPN